MGDGKSFPSEKERAFFIETSGKLSLSYRQSCALESFAFHNRNKWIELLIVVNNKTELKAGSSNLIRRLTCHYDNINVNYIHVENLINGTLLENWYYYSTWQTSPYKKAHLSDGLRLLLLFKYGGYYFDLDIIHIRPVGDSLRNFFTLQDQYQVCNAALHSDKQHNIIEISLQGFTQDYRYLYPRMVRWAYNSK